MSHGSNSISHSGDGRRQDTGNQNFSVILASLSSLMNAMSIAFSPFTAPTFAVHDDLFRDLVAYIPVNVGFLDHNTTSGDLTDSSVEESIHEVMPRPKTIYKGSRTISSTTNIIKNVIACFTPQIPIPVVSPKASSAKRQRQKTSKRTRRGRTPATSKISESRNNDGKDDIDGRIGLIIYNMNLSPGLGQQPNKRLRLMSPPTITTEGRRFCKRTACTYTVSNQNESDQTTVNKKIKKARTTIDCQYKIHKRNLKKPPRQWMKFFKILVAYKEKHHGSTMVSRCESKDKRLGRWVHRQRCKFRKNELSILQVNLLESIGFSWDGREDWNKKNTNDWREMDEEPISDKEENNNNVHRYGKDIRQLGTWAREKRWKLRTKTQSKNCADLVLFER